MNKVFGFVSVLMITTILSAKTWAVESVVQTGNCGTNCTWSVVDEFDDQGNKINQTIRISPTDSSKSGTMKEYDRTQYQGEYRTTAPWRSYWGSITNVVVEEGMTNVSGRAFMGLTEVKSATIADTVTKLGDQSFNRMSKLEAVNIPNSVTFIDYSVFGLDHKLTSLIIPDSVTRLNENSIAVLNNLSSLDLPDNPSLYIDTNVFFNNPKLLESSITCGGETCSQEMQNKLKNVVTRDGVHPFNDDSFATVTHKRELTE